MKQKTIWMIVAIVAIGVLLGYVKLPTTTTNSQSSSGLQGTPTTLPILQTADVCPASTMNVAPVVYNTLNDANVEYLNGTGYWYETATSDKSVKATITVTDNNPTDFAASCNKAYKVVIVGSETVISGELDLGVVNAQNQGDKRLDLVRHSQVKLKVNDITTGLTALNTSTSGTDYDNANGTVSASDGAITVGSDGRKTFDFYITTQTTTARFGDTQAVSCVEYDPNDLQKPTVTEDGRVLSTSDEYPSGNIVGLSQAAGDKIVCYRIGNVPGKTDKKLKIDILAKSGVNPDSDMYLWLLSEGKYLSVDGKTINTAIQKDDTSSSWVHVPQLYTIDLG